MGRHTNESKHPVFRGAAWTDLRSERRPDSYLLAVAVALVRPVEAAVIVWVKEPLAGAV